MPLAPPIRRFGAWVLDAVIAGVVFVPLNPGLYTDEPSASLFIALFIPTMILLFVYLVAFDGGQRGATPGKRILRLRVVDVETGGAIGWRRAAARRLVYLLGGAVLYAGWLWLFTNPRRQTWHDKAARTLVVSTD